MMSMAMVFPGQGSQAVGMLGAWSEQALVQKRFAAASEVLGFDLLVLVQSGDRDTLNLTVNAQPALLASSVAFYDLWQEKGLPKPAWMAGHSLGEFSALVCAGALGFEEAVALVRERGTLMQQAGEVRQGAMLAVIGLSDEQVTDLCDAAGNVSPANFNAPGQVVVSGELEAVSVLARSAKEAGARMLVPLPVTVASHCSLMQEATKAFGERLAAVSWSLPNIPVLHNIDAKPRDSVEGIRDALIQQLTQPVQWVATIQQLQSSGVDQIVECGPGQVLSKLCKRFKPAPIGLSFDKACDSLS